MYKKHKERQKMYCDICAQSFDLKSYLVTHIEKRHLKLRRYECNVCTYKAYFKSSLLKHKLIHRLKTECTVCHKMVADMAAHMRNHVKVSCPICQKTFSKPGLLQHIRTHKNDKEKIEHRCEKCQKTFKNASELRV